MKKVIILNLLALAAILSTIQAQSTRNRDLETIHNRVLTDLMSSSVDDARVKELVATLQPNGTWPNINYEDVSVLGFQHRQHLSNLLLMCRAYKKTGSTLKGNRQLKNAINLALNHWLEKDYMGDDGYNNQIATPGALTSMLYIMDRDFTPAQIAKALTMTARANTGAAYARQSGDRAAVVGIEAKNALYKHDEADFERLVKIIEGEMKFVPVDQRGMMYDYSLHHRADGVDNTLAYGSVLMGAFSEWSVLLNNTRYQFSEPALQMMVNYYLDGICKHMIYGVTNDPGARNRDIAYMPSYSASSRGSGGLLNRLLAVTNYRKDEVQEIIDLRMGVMTNPTLSYAKFFWTSEYFVFQRPGFFTSVRMMSRRAANTEPPFSSTGVLNHHRGDGMNYISVTGTEYDHLAPVYDWQKIPGITALQKAELPGESEVQKLGMMEYAGAVTDGRYGAVGYDFISSHDPVRIRKAWFFFDDEFVCLGADLAYQFRRDGGWRLPYPLTTTLNQSHLRGDVVVNEGGAEKTSPKGEHRFENACWVYHDNVGYIFVQPAVVFLSNQAATGNWYRVNKGNSTPREEISMDVFKLWIEHGPEGDWISGASEDKLSYQYIVMPGATKEQVAQASQNTKVEILSNTADMQAVWHKNLNMCQIVAYKNGTLLLPNGFQFVMESPGIYLLHFKNQGFELSVADPLRKQGKIQVGVNRKIESSGEHYLAQWNGAKGMSIITIDLPQINYFGQSVTLKF